MAKCNCCGLGPRATLLVVGIYTFIISLCYVVLSVEGLLAYSCDINLDGSKIVYAFSLFYFRNLECHTFNLTNIGVIVPPELQEIIENNIEDLIPAESQIAIETNRLVLCSLFVHGLTLIFSFLLIFGSCFGNCTGRCGHLIFYWPWIIFAIANIAFDVFATYKFTMDFIKSQEISGILDMFEIKDKYRDEMATVLQTMDWSFLLSIPSLLMMIVAAKGFIFWFISVANVIIVLCSVSQLWAMDKKIPPYSSREALTSPVSQKGQDQLVATRYMDPAEQNFSQRGSFGTTPSTTPGNQRFKQYENRGYEDELMRRYGIDPQLRREASPQRKYPDDKELERRYPRNDETKVSRPKYQPSPVRENEYRESLRPEPFNYLSHNEHTDETNSPRHSLAVPPAELRSQLPWSYFKKPASEEPAPDYSSTQIQFPKLKHVQKKENELPIGFNIPEPDYGYPEWQEPPSAPPPAPPPPPKPKQTLSQSKDYKASKSESSADEGKWSGTEYRY